jgi:peptidoglycan hydrolase-like protein with peptidoglycan-binding domain
LLAVPALASAGDQTSTTPATKPAQVRSAPAQKKKHHSTGHASSHTSANTSATHTSSEKGKNAHSRKGSSHAAKKRGQQAIDPDRAREIQTALIREHYMQGEPSGSWDSATQTAMRRYQADQGWQSKTIPDSRALIKLGLGPRHDHLLNPESAMTAGPAPGDPKAAAKQPPSQNNVPQQ